MGKIAFVFPGQGAQYPGMGFEIYKAYPAAQKVFEMGEGIRPGILKMCFEGSAEELSLTINTQPALFLVDLACAEVLKGIIEPGGAAGFSLGEIAAVAFCGLMPYDEAFRLVCKRAEYMHECAEKHKGAMAAILRLSKEAALEVCEKAKVYPVNFNCPGQIVAAGDEKGIENLLGLVPEYGGRAVRLPVSGAFHSPFMEEAADKMKNYLRDISLSAPSIPLYSNKTGQPYSGDAKALLSEQIKSPVKWQETIENMINAGFDTFIEAGAGKTLCGLIKKISKDVNTYNVENEESLKTTLSEMGKL